MKLKTVDNFGTNNLPMHTDKVIKDKSRGEVSQLEQETIEKIS